MAACDNAKGSVATVLDRGFGDNNYVAMISVNYRNQSLFLFYDLHGAPMKKQEESHGSMEGRKGWKRRIDHYRREITSCAKKTSQLLSPGASVESPAAQKEDPQEEEPLRIAHFCLW